MEKEEICALVLAWILCVPKGGYPVALYIRNASLLFFRWVMATVHERLASWAWLRSRATKNSLLLTHGEQRGWDSLEPPGTRRTGVQHFLFLIRLIVLLHYVWRQSRQPRATTSYKTFLCLRFVFRNMFFCAITMNLFYHCYESKNSEIFFQAPGSNYTLIHFYKKSFKAYEFKKIQKYLNLKLRNSVIFIWKIRANRILEKFEEVEFWKILGNPDFEKF